MFPSSLHDLVKKSVGTPRIVAVTNSSLRRFVLLWLLLASTVALRAETVDSLSKPTGYVSDFAGVLSPAVQQQVESLCTAVDRQTHAQIAVVTIKTLDGDQSIEEFATQLEEKWGVGAKGTDRGVLMLLVMTPRRGRIEVGYGLEGILNDAKVGDIGRSMVPDAREGNYNAAVPLGVQQIANVIARDAGVTIQPIVRSDRRVSQPAPFTIGPMLVFGIIFLFIVLSSIGRGGRGGGGGGLGWFVLGNLLGGMGGRGRGGYGGGGFGGGFGGGGGGDGGGFGGFGGGSSGGGGASGDF